MHEAIGITLVHQGSRKPFLAQDTNLPWQISLCGSDRRLFYAQAKKAYKHMKARKDMNLASRQHHQLLHEVHYDGCCQHDLQR